LRLIGRGASCELAGGMATVIADGGAVAGPPSAAAGPSGGTGSGDRTHVVSVTLGTRAGTWPDDHETPVGRFGRPGITKVRAGPGAGVAGAAGGQWRARLQEVAELSLAYHDAAAIAAAAPADRGSGSKLQQLRRRTAAARRALADTDDALARLASGRYGLCEACAAAIPARLLAAAPDARYCPHCSPKTLSDARPGGRAAPRGVGIIVAG